MKKLLAITGLLGMLVLAGCMGGVVSEEALREDATYDWDTNATVTVDVSGSAYQAVYDVTNRSTIELYQRGDLGGEEPIPIRAIQFRYPNGTVVNASAMEVTESDSRTVVELPAEEGRFAYTANSASSGLFFPAVVDGSYEVILPPGTRMSLPIIGYAEPAGFEKTVTGDRVHLTWETVSQDVISVGYYLQRDLYIFTGLIGLLGVVAGGGWLYFRYQLKGLESRREEAGLDVEEEQ